MNWNVIGYISMIVGLIALAIVLNYKLFTNGKNSEDYEIVCIHGHSYWVANFAYKGMLAIRLNDDGTPVKCTVVNKQ